MRAILMSAALLLGGVCIVAAQSGDPHAKGHPQHEATGTAEGLGIPAALEAEHQEIHESLVAIIGFGGKTGEAAEALAARLHEHFGAEQAIAMPPLGLLVPLSRGEMSPEIQRIAKLGEKLEADLPKMLAEHVRIVEAAEALKAAGAAEGHTEAQEFAEKLILHAQNEEQVLYPSAILVGRYVRMKTDS